MTQIASNLIANEESSLSTAAQNVRRQTLSYLRVSLEAQAAGLESEMRMFEAEEAEEIYYATRSRRDGDAAQRAIDRAQGSLIKTQSALDAALTSVDACLAAWKACELAFSRASDLEISSFSEACRKALGSGSIVVTLEALETDELDLADVVVQSILVSDAGYSPADAIELVKRAIHLGPQEILSGVGFDEAVSLKEQLRLAGAEVGLSEAE